MKPGKLGCLTGSGLMVVLLTLLVIGGLVIVQGGVMFSPGAMNAQAGGTTLGGVRSHAELGGRCKACHSTPWGQRGMSDLCVACHLDISEQAGQSGTLHGTLLARQSLECSDCHPEHNGAEAPLTVMDTANFPHDAVGYSLEGHANHAEGSAFTCADCHQGDITRFDVVECETCHQDLDAGFTQFHTAAFGLACLGCHDGIDTYGADFDHALYFPLEGEHNSEACGGCHENARTKADFQRAPRECFECHKDDDEHNGEFGQDCAVCHTPVDWEKATFDHALSGFPLEGEHAEVECENCHRDDVYAGTPAECYACHEQDDEHHGEFGTDCAACHTPVDWEQVSFDHAQSNFPLEGEHAEVECEKCHRDDVYAGTPTECYACHEQDDEHNGEFGSDCAACHTPVDWEGATFDHSLSAFPLTGAHINVECTDCHQGGIYAGTPQECLSCHEEPAYHAGAFGTQCADCHSTSAWSPAEYNQPHTFPLNHGESGRVSCDTCHPDNFNTYTCYGCHEHNQSKVEREHREEGISNFSNCMECHPTGREHEGEGRGGDDDDD